MKCIYCSSRADTREHCPSKIFLNNPLPYELPTLPACKKCNNNFSEDELYVGVLLELLISNINDCRELSTRTQSRIESRVSAQEAYRECLNIINGKRRIKDSRIENIIEKLAIGHCIYELSEGFNIGNKSFEATKIEFEMKDDLWPDKLKNFHGIYNITNTILPEIGSRIFDKIFVLEANIQAINSTDKLRPKGLFLDWTVVQEKNYRYICYRDGENIWVRIVMKETFFAYALFEQVR